MNIVSLLRRSASDLLSDTGGWAVRTLLHSTRSAILLALAGWQLVQLGALFSRAPEGQGPLALGHLLLAGFALLCWRRRFSPIALILLADALAIGDWALADDPNSVLAFATTRLVNLAAVATTFIVPGRRAVILSLATAVLVPLAAHEVSPDWGWEFPSALLVTQLATLVGSRVGMVSLVEFARTADRAREDAERQLQQAQVASATRRQVAEDTRTLHDSVINTLGAIADGGSAMANVQAVREQCAADLAVITELEDARGDRQPLGILDVLDASPIAIHRTGADDETVACWEDDLGASATHLLAGAIREVLRNATKHSGAAVAEIDLAQVGGELVVTVTDDGVGFESQLPADRGFATSVGHRVEELGGAVTIDSAQGRGTTVILRVPMVEPASATPLPAPDFDQLTRELQVSAGWIWAVGVIAVGIVIEAVNRVGQLTPTYLMHACILGATAVAWLSRRNAGSPVATWAVLAVSASAGFVLSAASVGFGQEDVLLWQPLVPTASLVILLCSRPPRPVLWGALALYFATVTGVTIVVAQYSPSAAAVIPVAGMVAVCLVGTWAGFQRATLSIGSATAADLAAAFQAKLDVDLRAAAQRVHQRWVAAGLASATQLLRDTAEGRRDPRDDATRRSCRAEDRYLRQLMGLSPDLVVVGFWLTAAINESRSRGVTLTIRAGDDDLDAYNALLVGRLLSTTIARTQPRSALTATLFATARGPQFTLVGPHPFVSESARRVLAVHEGLRLQRLGDLDVVELVLHRRDGGPGT